MFPENTIITPYKATVRDLSQVNSELELVPTRKVVSKSGISSLLGSREGDSENLRRLFQNFDEFLTFSILSHEIMSFSSSFFLFSSGYTEYLSDLEKLKHDTESSPIDVERPIDYPRVRTPSFNLPTKTEADITALQPVMCKVRK